MTGSYSNNGGGRAVNGGPAPFERDSWSGPPSGSPMLNQPPPRIMPGGMPPGPLSSSLGPPNGNSMGPKSTTQVTIPKDVSFNSKTRPFEWRAMLKISACWGHHRQRRRQDQENPAGFRCWNHNRRASSRVQWPHHHHHRLAQWNTDGSVSAAAEVGFITFFMELLLCGCGF